MVNSIFFVIENFNIDYFIFCYRKFQYSKINTGYTIFSALV